MQKSDFHNLTRNNWDRTKFNKNNRDRSGGHWSPSSNHNGHSWWKKHDRKLQRRNLKQSTVEALKDHETGELEPCPYCGDLHEDFFCPSYMEDMSYDCSDDPELDSWYTEVDEYYDPYDPYTDSWDDLH